VVRPALLRPEWPAPPGVGAAMSLRGGGLGIGPYAGFNLGVAVGDEPVTVAVHRGAFARALGARPVWLRQVHDRHVLRLDADTPEHPDTPADAAWTSERGLACTVQIADCMPVLFALRDGSAVAAAHAGWRGLAGGVLEATLQALCEGMGTDASQVQAWLGPCIGPRQFEVGADVLQAFGVDLGAPDPACFVARPRPDGSPRWLANLPALAAMRLRAAGVAHVSTDGRCTVEDASAFFSFRRDGVTGRMACAIWRL
jgi:YfiH family protein